MLSNEEPKGGGSMSEWKWSRASILIVLLMEITGLCMVSTVVASEQARTAQAVDSTKLVAFLPSAPAGWYGKDPFDVMQSAEGGTWSLATKSYSKHGAVDNVAQVGITDYAFYTAGWSNEWKKFYAFESTEGYAKTVTIKGYPAWEIYTKNGNNYGLYVGINDRFLVVITTNSDLDTLYNFANSIDYKGIAALAGKASPSPAVTGSTTEQTTRSPATAAPTRPPGMIPGFESVFAVIGLLAVVYLLKRADT